VLEKEVRFWPSFLSGLPSFGNPPFVRTGVKTKGLSVLGVNHRPKNYGDPAPSFESGLGWMTVCRQILELEGRTLEGVLHIPPNESKLKCSSGSP
jgi:hypothetical protein